MKKEKSKKKPTVKFQDEDGREWSIRLHIGAFQKVLNDTGFNIGKPDDEGQIPGMSDLITFCQILFSVLEKQANEYGLGPEEFAECMWGDTLHSAQIAFMEAYADFCPSQQAKAIRRRLATIRKAVDHKMNEEVNLSDEELLKQASGLQAL